MPRKRWNAKLKYYDVPKIDPSDRNAVEDHHLVRHALVDFDEIAVLPEAVREQLVADLVDAIRFARGGLSAGRRGVSDKALAKQVFLADVGRSLERAKLPVKRWRKEYDERGGESFFFELARAVAEVSKLPALPKDLKLLGKLSAQVKFSGHD